MYGRKNMPTRYEEIKSPYSVRFHFLLRNVRRLQVTHSSGDRDET